MRVDHLLDFVEGVHASFNRSVAEAALEKTDVNLNKKIHVLSKGMNVQLHLAIALAIDAEILVLDEPTLGLDILYRQRFYDSVLNDYYQENRSILITTHEVREIEHILTDVVFIHRGKACLSLTMDELNEQFCKLTVGQESVPEIRALAPIAERKTLQGTEFVFRGADTATLAHKVERLRPVPHVAGAHHRQHEPHRISPVIDLTAWYSAGIPQSDVAEYVERITAAEDGSRLDYRITITDPETFTDPVVLEKFWVWLSDVRLERYDCTVGD